MALRFPLTWRATIFVAVATLGLTAALVVWGQWRSFSEGVVAYSGVRLGSPAREIAYRLGYPSSVRARSAKDFVAVDQGRPNNGLPPGTKLEDYSDWLFTQPSGSELVIYFGEKPAKVQAIVCYAEAGGNVCPPLLGVHVGTSEDGMIRRLGPPTEPSFLDNQKLAPYDDIGVVFILGKAQVRNLGISKQKKGGATALRARFLETLLP